MNRTGQVIDIKRFRQKKLPRLCNPSKTVTIVDQYKERRGIYDLSPDAALKLTSFDFDYYIRVLSDWKGGEDHQEAATTDAEGTEHHC